MNSPQSRMVVTRGRSRFRACSQIDGLAVEVGVVVADERPGRVEVIKVGGRRQCGRRLSTRNGAGHRDHRPRHESCQHAHESRCRIRISGVTQAPRAATPVRSPASMPGGEAVAPALLQHKASGCCGSGESGRRWGGAMMPPLPHAGGQRRSITTTTLVRRMSCQTSQQAQTPQSTVSTEAPSCAVTPARWFAPLWCRGPHDHPPSPGGGQSLGSPLIGSSSSRRDRSGAPWRMSGHQGVIMSPPPSSPRINAVQLFCATRNLRNASRALSTSLAWR